MLSNKGVTRLAIFASGGGSNAEAIIQHFSVHSSIQVALIVANNPKAYVLERAKNHGIENLVISNEQLKNSDELLLTLENREIDFIILAGFLKAIPLEMVRVYSDKIINIHPALLPKYGGKGMYGKRVHQAVFDNMESESGMTIHYVNEKYDEGKIIFQDTVALDITDTPDIIASKVLKLEHQHYPQVIAQVITA